MHHQTQTDLQLLQAKLRKICRQLQQLVQSGKILSTKKLQSLTKRRDRCLRKLMNIGIPLAKAGGAFAFATFFAAQVQAQDCNKFHNADRVNSLQNYYDSSYSIIAHPAFIDIDGDGDLDCYTYGVSVPVFFRNVGTKDIPSYIYAGSQEGGFTGYVAEVVDPAFADMDGDGDYDCFVPAYDYMTYTYYIKYLENVGTITQPNFVENEANNPLDFATGDYLPLELTIADIDGDGDYDAYFSNWDYHAHVYYEHVYKNTGTKTVPEFKEVYKGTVDGSWGSHHRVYYDWNKDGLVDYFDSDKRTFYRNIGPSPGDLNYVPDTVNGPDLPDLGSGWGSALWALVDVNNDGVPEVFTDQSNMYTVTPVPAIQARVGPSDITLLHATPKEKGYKYQWQRNGKDIPFATRPILPVLIPGYYTVTITSNCGTGFSSPYAYKTHAATFAQADALPYTELKKTIAPLLKAYPNPFTQQFTLTLGNMYKPGSTTVRITDIQGRVVNVVKATGSTLHLGETLQRGVYIVQVLQNNIVVFTQKIIKE